MKFQYYTAASLDGFLADANHSLDWLNALPHPANDGYERFIANVGAVVMGSHTYEWVLRHNVDGGGAALPWPYSQPAWVFSSRDLPAVANADVRVVRGDVRPVASAMRETAGDRNVWIVGGGDLAGQFHDAGLLDEILVTITAVTLGSGMPLLPRRITSPPLRLTNVERLDKHFVTLTYAVPR